MNATSLPATVHVYRCSKCALEVVRTPPARPPGQCPSCHAIGTCFVLVPPGDVRPLAEAPSRARKPATAPNWGLPTFDPFGPGPIVQEPVARPVAVAAAEIESTDPERHLTGIPIFDRALGYSYALGAAMGGCTSLSGPPGAGKTTLCLQAIGGHASNGLRCLIITGEQQPAALTRTLRRMGVSEKALALIKIVWCDDFDMAIELIDENEAEVVMVDSLQMQRSKHATGRRRSVAQIDYGSLLYARRCAAAKDGPFEGRPPLIGYLIVHADDDGDMAGPEAARHNVDTLALLEHFDPITGEALPPKRRLGYVRMLVEKNRFGDATGNLAEDSRGLEVRLELRFKKPEGYLIGLRG